MKRRINFPQNLSFRNYQLDFVMTAKRLLREQPETWHLFYAPTGTGKSICEELLLNDLDNSILITPRIEIIRDMLEKGGTFAESLNDIVTTGQSFGIHTPIRLRNTLAAGKLSYRPDTIIVDEAQHDLAETYQDLIMYLNYCGKVGLTASPYRGTPKSTKQFLEQWNNKVHTIISLKQAVDDKFIAIPIPEVWPLVDDDEIVVQNGEFRTNVANKFVFDRIKDLVLRCKQYWDKHAKLWDRRTIFAVPTTESVWRLVGELNANGLPAVGITQASTRTERADAFEKFRYYLTAIVQIDVVSEGVDLPVERIVDIKPTMSPVRWIQQIGRTRAIDPPGEYICCCRNIERHGYLMDGLWPNSVFVEAQEAFKVPSKRSGVRVTGLEGMGRFTHCPIHCLDGTTAFMYNLVNVEGFKRTEYVFLIHPNSKEPLKAKREIPRNEDGMYDYKKGKWALIESIPDLKGFSSAHASTLTDKQSAWFKKDAERYGLNPYKEVTNRNFQVLPLLMNLSSQFGKIVRL